MINIARDVNKAVEEVSNIPMLGFINDIVDFEIADPDPIRISVIIINIFFLFIDLHIFLYFSLSALRDLSIFS